MTEFKKWLQYSGLAAILVIIVALSMIYAFLSMVIPFVLSKLSRRLNGSNV